MYLKNWETIEENPNIMHTIKKERITRWVASSNCKYSIWYINADPLIKSAIRSLNSIFYITKSKAVYGIENELWNAMRKEIESTYQTEEDHDINDFQVEKIRPIYKVSPYRIVYVL